MIYKAIFAWLILDLGVLTTASDLRSTCKSTSIEDGYKSLIDKVQTCAFPTDKFNFICILAGIPQLNSQLVCPLVKNGNFTRKGLESILEIVSNSLKLPSLCGLPFNPIPAPPNITFTISDLIDDNSTSGICNFADNPTPVIENLNLTALTLSKDKILITITNLTYAGMMTCNFYKKTSNYSMNNAIYHNSLSFVAELSFDKTKTYSDGDYGNVTFIEKFTPPSDSIMNPEFEETLATFQRLFYKLTVESNLPIYVGNFVSALINAVVQEAKLHCL
ncbi:hypothetical protein CHUAL_006516 [Chamberlinius hualienensis]